MEMESSRRPPYDRSREPGLKKPRLAEQSAVVVDRNPNGRTVAQRPANSGGSVPGSGLAKYRANNIDRDRDSESSDSARGPNQQQQHQELVSQYRTALAELTFNSKPIITNLTIIAGENLHAAKAIAATVCANIIEVPSDQKLPSLYLLDSIVKNIGRDYIKYFAAKLPEVFCKAYRQVESAVHTAMRHLFGTWKGVFPPQPLQMIEKELEFSPAANGSSTGSAGARVDPESQRPGRIHINPKYLEARQRLEQSSRVKGESNDNTGVLGKSPDDAVSLDRAVGSTSGKSLADPRLKMQNIQRSLKDLAKESVGEKNNAAAYGGYEFSTDVSGHPGVEPGRASERAGERKFDKSWYASVGNVTEAMSSKRNTIDTKPGFASYLAPTTTGTNAHLLPAQSTAGRSITGTNRSWKNSEEEEYMWNDMNSKSTDYDKINSSRKDVSMPDSSDRLGFVNHLQKPHDPDSFNSRIDREPLIDSLPIEQKDHLGNLISSSWTKEPYSTDGIIHLGGSRITPGHSDAFPSASSLTRMSVRPQVGPSQVGPSGFGFVSKPVSSSSGLLGQRHYMGAASTLDQPLSHHGHQLLHNLRDQDHLQNQPFGRQELRTSQFSGPINVKPSNQSSQASMPPNAYPGNSHILQSHDLQTPLMPSVRRAPFPERLSPDPLQSEQSNKSYFPHNAISRNPPTTLGLPSSGHANPLAAESSGQPNPSSLLATIMKSGILNKSVTSSVPTPSFPVLGVKGSQPTSSGPRVGVESPPGLNTNDKVLAAAVPTQRKVDHPTVPPGRLPPSVVENESSQVSQSANPALVSNLLSSLFSKGLITSSKSEPKPSVPQQVHTQTQSQKSNIVSSGSVPISSVSVTATISAPSDIKLSKPEAEGSSGLLHSPNIKPLLGCEFKQDVIRQANPAVVRELIDDLPHQCNICGVRLKLQQRLERHLEWHKSVEANSLNKASRRWYVNSADWIAGKARTDSGNESICVSEAMEIEMESSEDMVLADESQCVCVLCGELFEDFYSLEKNDWMFKGAVYMPTSLGNDKMGETSSGGIFKGPIVHANCMSNISALDMELVGSMKLEKDG